MTAFLEASIQLLITERDEYQKAAVRTAVNCKAEIDKLTADRDAFQAADLMMTGERDAAVKGRDELGLANRDLIDWFDALKTDHDKLLAAGKIALEACIGFCRAPMTQVEYLSLLRVIAALKAAGVP